MEFQLCENTGFYLRMALLGPSGAGKSYTALSVATELGFEKVGIIDTENGSARRYARSFRRRFTCLELSSFGPRDYIDAIEAARKAGIEVLVIDSLSHAWMGKGGVLEMVDQSARRQARGSAANSFNGWREVTPEHNRLVEAMIRFPGHLLVTMRVKTEYLVEKDDKGRSIPRKVGLAPVQRDGLEYEFDVLGEVDLDHTLCITKSRCPRLADAVLQRPGAELAQTLRAWLDGADGAPRAPEPPQDPTEALRDRIAKGRAEMSDELRRAREAAGQDAVPPQEPAGWAPELMEEARQRIRSARTGDAYEAAKAWLNQQKGKRSKAQGQEIRQELAQKEKELAGPPQAADAEQLAQELMAWLKEELAQTRTVGRCAEIMEELDRRLAPFSGHLLTNLSVVAAKMVLAREQELKP